MRQALFGGLPGEAVFQASFLPFWVTGSMTATAAG